MVALWLAAGCGPPQMVPVVMPGSKRAVEIPEHEQAEAIGEQQAMGTIQPPVQTYDLTLPLAQPTKPGESVTTADRIKIETIRAGTGPQAKPGNAVQIHYVGTLTNGAQFDNSRIRNTPWVFQLGADGGPVRGFQLGVAGMHVGELRRITIPPDLAYKSEGIPGRIPPNATLVFEVELLGVAQ